MSRGIAASYTKHPAIGLAEQIRQFLSKHGTSSGVEVRKGIAKSIDDSRYIVIDVNSTLNNMAKSGQLSREKMSSRSYYSLDLRRAIKPRNNYKLGTKEAARQYKFLRKKVNKIEFDIRDDVLSEAYLRLSIGVVDKVIDLDELIDICRRHVLKEFRGGWRETFTVDGALNEDGFNLLDVLSDEDTEHVDLFLLEKQTDKIKKLERDGWEEDQLEHLWYTGGTTWLHRNV